MLLCALTLEQYLAYSGPHTLVEWMKVSCTLSLEPQPGLLALDVLLTVTLKSVPE